jgi:hypothetical protein
MKLVVENRWMGDGTAYFWKAEEDGGALYEGMAGSLPEALRDAGNTLQKARGWQGLVALALTEVVVSDFEGKK